MEQVWSPYCGQAPLPGEWLMRWNLDALVMMVFVAVVGWALRRNDIRPQFWLGLSCLALLFLSPLCALSSALFSVRVVHHVVLTTVAAPLIAAGFVHFRWRLGVILPAVVHAALFWFWHAPKPYGLALSNDAIYWAMQVSLFASAVGFWGALRLTPAPQAIVVLLVMMVQMGLLGALITFAGTSLYAPHLLTVQPWGMTPLEDQQLAGIIMWAPASALYLAGALWVARRLLSPERSRIA